MPIDFSEILEVEVSKQFIDELYEKKEIQNEFTETLPVMPGGFCFFIDEQNRKAVAINIMDDFCLIDSFKNKTINGFKPKDVRQAIYFNLLVEEEFDIVVALGAAGTGKTTIAVAQALSDYMTYKKKIILCKPTHLVQSHQNHVFGPGPGDMQEKYAPYIGSFEIVLNKVMGEHGKSYLDAMVSKKHLEFMPVEFTRGCTFEHCTFILDECQNLSWHELKTVLSRIGKDSKIILCGDPNQIDAGFLYKESGLYTLVESESFQDSDFTSIIKLTKQYRGRIPDLIFHIDKEIIKNNYE